MAAPTHGMCGGFPGIWSGNGHAVPKSGCFPGFRPGVTGKAELLVRKLPLVRKQPDEEPSLDKEEGAGEEEEGEEEGAEEELEESEGGEDAELDPDQAQMVWPNIVVALPDKPPGALPDEPEARPDKPPGALPDAPPEALPDTLDTPPEA